MFVQGNKKIIRQEKDIKIKTLLIFFDGFICHVEFTQPTQIFYYFSNKRVTVYQDPDQHSYFPLHVSKE